MLKILLLRHAKSSWEDPNLRDFDRPLSNRGINDTRLMRDYIVSLVKEVDQIYSSPSVRTKQTIKQLMPDYFQTAKYLKKLYLANSDDIFNLLRSIKENNKVVMIVGHNPGLQTTLEIILNQPIEKFPTCALAVIALQNNWCKSALPVGDLLRFVKPRDFK
tara:strand:+ start:50 stop:532 length:483 start_codon:yes stop_codon:yes gene_type:complete